MPKFTPPNDPDAVIAALDVGSNTLKMILAEKTGRSFRVFADQTVTTRIGENLDQTGTLSAAAIQRTLAGLKELVLLARSLGATHIQCVGTAGLRGADNAAAFLAQAKRELDIDIEVIDGVREAELSFRAPAEIYGPGPLVVLDVGGRSTEIVTGSITHDHEGEPGGIHIDAAVSLELGSVRLTERLTAQDPPLTAELLRVYDDLRDTLTRLAPLIPDKAPLMGVSGTVLSLMGLHLGLDDHEVAVVQGEGQPLLLSDVRALYEDLRKKTTRERVQGTVLPMGRADVIVAGALIVIAVLEHYQRAFLIATNGGVRMGLLYEALSRLPGPG